MADWIDPENGIRLLIVDRLELDEDQVRSYPEAELPTSPYVSVEVIDGYATELEDEPIVEINVWAERWSQVKSLHTEISDAILRYPRSVTVGNRRFVVDNPRCNSRASREDWPDEKIRRM